MSPLAQRTKSVPRNLSRPPALLKGHRSSAANEGASRKRVIATKASEASLVQVEVASGSIYRDGMDRTCEALLSVRDGHTLSTGALVGCGPRRSDHCGVVGENIDELGVL